MWIIISLIVLCSAPAWAVDAISNPDGTYTVSLSAEEAAILDRAKTAFGPAILKELLRIWLEDRKKTFEESDRKTMKEAYEGLPKAKKDQVKALLGIAIP